MDSVIDGGGLSPSSDVDRGSAAPSAKSGENVCDYLPEIEMPERTGLEDSSMGESIIKRIMQVGC